MSVILIRAALEAALNSIEPEIFTDFENVGMTPDSGSPYQAAFVMFAEPDNPEQGDNFRQERGIFQINLNYARNKGSGDAAARAELIKTVFHRAATFTAGNITVTVERTPWVGQGTNDSDRWVLPVKIRFYSNISS